MIDYPIGQILIEMGVLSEAQLEAALHVQKVSQLALGEILLDLNFLTNNELASAIALQFDLEYLDLDTFIPDNNVLRMIDKEVAEQYIFLPVFIDHNLLTVTTSRPSEDLKLFLKETTGKDIAFKVSSSSAILKYIQIYYDLLANYSIEDQINSIIEQAALENEVDIINLSDLIIKHATMEHATDIHMIAESSTSHIFYRIDGVLKHYYALPYTFHHNLSIRWKVLAKLELVNNISIQSGEFKYNSFLTNYNIRISIVPTIKGEKIALRLLPENFKLYNLESLGFEKELSQKIERYLNKRSGMLLVIGPSGSGKSTTLYSMMRKLNILERNVLSIEEPVEFKLPFISQIEINDKVGITYQKAIRNVARQDPDVIILGEILDEDTARLAIQTAMSGHLVLSTIFGDHPSSVLTRLMDFKINSSSISEGLTAILSQKLVRRLCPHCKEPVKITKDKLLNIFNSPLINDYDKNSFTLYQPKGCLHCKESGYMGRVAIAEFLEIDEEISTRIRSKEIPLTIDEYVKENSIRTIKEDALIKVLQGITSVEEVQYII
jgi:type IV pilus assembly protein PilB